MFVCFRLKKPDCFLGSQKLDSFCTAFMKIKRDVESDRTTITACFQHYGHDIELCHLRLPRQDR